MVVICTGPPFKHEGCATQKGYFSSNLESVRKDVECLFGILKKRWKILEYGIHFPDIKVCKKLFFVCSILHNMMLDDGETRDNSVRVGRGGPLDDDAIWLRDMPDERSAATTASEAAMVGQWNKCRNDLAAHCKYMARAAKRRCTA